MSSDARLALDLGEVTPGGTKRKRRPRAAVACDTCRTRKVKCDGDLPCSNCVQHTFSCTYKERQQVISIDPRDTEPQAMPIASSTARVPRHDVSQQDSSTRLPPTSPVSLDEPRGCVSPAKGDSRDPVGPDSTMAAPTDGDLGGLGQINAHTEGAEFYGPTGTFYFLSRLRSQANSHKQKQPLSRHRNHQYSADRTPAETSVVNLLHSSDYTSPDESRVAGHHPSGPHATNHLQPGCLHDDMNGSPHDSASKNIEIERECVRLYFQNLHCVHPILDQSAFLSRCEREIWKDSESIPAASPQVRSHTRLLALFNVVLAIGAVTAGESSLLTWDQTVKFLDQTEKRDEGGSTYTPIRVARLFFERAKLYIEDVYESTCLETAQTLFLMSVFCQNALKPHACYMYSGMAIRTALAMGIPTTRSSSIQESLLWWSLYSHEIEMCSSAGRQSFLKEPNYYQISLPSVSRSRGPSLDLVTCMVNLAEILVKASCNSSQPYDVLGTETMSRNSTTLHNELSSWKASLPRQLDFESSSLEESELVTKQKIVLKLRYLNAKILLHRPFLITRATSLKQDVVSNHIMWCVEAAKDTISFMHTTYLHRPYFRTWWYNCTYVLDASMVLLYVVLSKICPLPVEGIFRSVEQSLEILTAMRMVAVARRCTEITQDVLSIAKKSQWERHGQSEPPTRQRSRVPSPDEHTFLDQLASAATENNDLGDSYGSFDLPEEGSYATLVDNSLVFNLLNFDDWNAWSEAGY